MIEIRELADITPYFEEWDDLALEQENFFCTSDWILSWLEDHDDLGEPYILGAFEDDRLVGVAPLMICKQGLPGFSYRLLQFIGTGLSDYGDILATGDDVYEAFLTHIHHHRGKWDVCDLREINSSSETFLTLPSALRNLRMPFSTYKMFSCYHMEIGAANDEAYDIRNTFTTMKRLRNQGRISISFAGNAASINDKISYLVRFLNKRWGADDGSMFSDSRNSNFLRIACQHALASKQLALFSLDIDDKPIAVLLGFQFKGRFIIYSHAYDERWTKYHPGRLLLKQIIYHYQDKVALIDFSRGLSLIKNSCPIQSPGT